MGTDSLVYIDRDSSARRRPTGGRMNVRFNQRRKKYRLRFTSVHEDQLRVIERALEVSRQEATTTYDVVALEMICLSYLANLDPKPRPKPRKTPNVNPNVPESAQPKEE